METEEYTLMDTEQCMDGRIFSISVAHVWINHTHGTMHLGEPMTYFVQESFQDEFKNDKKSFEKLTSTWFDLKVKNLPYAELPFHKILEKISRRVVDNGCTLVSHSIDRDLNFLWKSDQFYNAMYNSPRFFSNHPLSYPGECTRNCNWKKIHFVCSQRVFMDKCPTFRDKYMKGGSSVQSIGAAIFGTTYTEVHHSIDDLYDLYKILHEAYICDKFRIGKRDFYITKRGDTHMSKVASYQNGSV